MAVDTAGKRFSLVGFGSPVPSVLPIPDGAIDAEDKADFLYLYSGITLSSVIDIWTIQTADTTLWSVQTADSSLWVEQTPDATNWAIQ